MEIKVNSELKYLVDSIDGKESIPDEEVFISEEEPEDGKIWINTGEVSNLGTEVVDSLEGNQTNKAPSVHAIKEAGFITDISGKQDKITSTNKLAYSLISGTPTIPTVNNATLTIQKNGTNVATFTSNASSNVTANITVPTVNNTLTSTSTSDALSAAQGKVLNDTLSAKTKTLWTGSAKVGSTITVDMSGYNLIGIIISCGNPVQQSTYANKQVHWYWNDGNTGLIGNMIKVMNGLFIQYELQRKTTNTIYVDYVAYATQENMNTWTALTSSSASFIVTGIIGVKI